MDQAEMETLIRNIDARTKRIEERTTRIEQILPTFATKDDLQAMKIDARDEGERTRRHFDAVAEAMKAQIGLIAEGHRATRVYVDERVDDTRAMLESYGKRILKLEAKSMKTADKPKRRPTRS